MNITPVHFAIGLMAYAIGNINPSIILGKIYHLDIRNEGSGNAGMTNTMRVIGLKAGIIVFVVDVLKAFIAVKTGYGLGESAGAMIAFGAVVLGHCFPVLWKFKGGKGVAASIGAALALSVFSTLGAIIVAVIALFITRTVSVASIAAAITFPVFVAIYQPEYLFFAVGAGLFLVVMHIPNIKRIIKGEEPPLKIGNRKLNESDDTGDSEDRDDDCGKEGQN